MNESHQSLVLLTEHIIIDHACNRYLIIFTLFQVKIGKMIALGAIEVGLIRHGHHALTARHDAKGSPVCQ